MKITVDRTNDSEGNLVFTITVKEPHVIPFPEEEKKALDGIDQLTKLIETSLDSSKPLYNEIMQSNRKIKENVFVKSLEKLKFSIQNEFRPKFQPICQEIYNWIYDKQQGVLKNWMIEYDPQRTTYYFDNDGKTQNPINTPFISEDKIDEDDDFDEDEG